MTSLDRPGSDAPQLRRVLGRTHLLAFGIGAIIGAGIFVVPGPVAAQFAGPSLIVSMAISALGCVLAGLCYAEMAALFPLTGSAYSYSFRVFGPFVGWLIGWLLLLEYLLAAGVLAVGWSGYFMSLLGMLGKYLPQYLTASPLAADPAGTITFGAGILNLPAVVILFAAGLVALRNVKVSATVNSIITFTKIAVILLVICAGLRFVNPMNWHPFIPENAGRWGQFGVSGIVRGAAITFYVYLGFDTVAVAAQEARNPQRDIPFGIIGSIVVCALIFGPFVLVLTGLTSYRNLNVSQPIAVAVAAVSPHLNWLRLTVSVAAIVGIFSVLLIVLMAQARILYAMALDGLVPVSFGRIHSRFHTPAAGTLLTTGVAAVIAAVLPISLLAQMVSFGALTAFIATAVAVLVLRRTQPHLPRPFRIPWTPGIPLCAIAICSGLLMALPRATWIRSAIWILIGLVIYWVYGRRRAVRLRSVGNASSILECKIKSGSEWRGD